MESTIPAFSSSLLLSKSFCSFGRSFLLFFSDGSHINFYLPFTSQTSILKGHCLTLCKCSLSDDESAGLLCILGFPLTWVHFPASFHYLSLQPLLPVETLSLSSFKRLSGSCFFSINLSVSPYRHPWGCHGSSQCSTWHMCSVTHSFDFL